MDLALFEAKGNGGDYIRKTNDLYVIDGFQSMPYISLFGGNTEASTKINRPEAVQAFDFWGNSLIPNNASIQFNSETERTLMNTALTSAGRIVIENAVKKDLAFMSDFADVTVQVSIISTDKVRIYIKIMQPDNLQNKEFIYIWSATRRELLNPYDGENAPDSVHIGFDYNGFDFPIE